ncbi:MAG: HigA family addiction module antitoxin [Pseudomonadota bacterium]|jgi:addiction module HigA family antidote|nr:HigA family addiction module antitoxin [Pseudomonadota bacterium]
MVMGMTPPHPGDFLRMEVLEPLNLDVTRAADILGVRRATVSDLLNGRAALSPEMALRWEKAFDVSMEMMLRMQAAYDAAQMRQCAGNVTVKRYEPA